MQQKTIVFDFGGVIFTTDTEAFYRERFNRQGRSAAELDYFLTHVFSAEDRSHSNGGNVQDLIDRKILIHPEWADEIRAYGVRGDFIKTIEGIIPGMTETIAELTAAGHRVAGLTNWHGDTYDVLAAAYPSILGHFNQVVVSGKIGLRKPDPEIFRHAQAAYGNPDPKTVYYFDDKTANTDSARKTVGWQSFPFTGPETVRRALALPPRRV